MSTEQTYLRLTADPEAGVTRNDNNEVINSNGVLSYPLQRTITFGANITF